jgi:hypothetical protein
MQDLLDLTGKKFGKCTIEKPLARGGYGYSYIGYDAELEKRRVIKVSKITSGLDEREEYALANFRREGIILSRLKHPQIVDLMEQGEEYGFRYMIIEFINGFDLGLVIKLLKKKQEELGCAWNELLDPATALGIILSSLSPLAYAHKVKIALPDEGVVEGLAHRDISAGNLILGAGHEHEGKIHLIDFGVAKTNFDISATISTGVVGSVKYMSPMRIMRKTTKDKDRPYWKAFRQTQHDVHAMGCLFWELLTGESVIDISDNDLAASLAAVQNPETYSELYKQAGIFDRDIQDIIRKSILLPDIKNNSIPFQFKDASHMSMTVQHVYDRVSGRAPVQEVLGQLAREIENPSKLEIARKGRAQRITGYSKTGKVKTGMVRTTRSGALMAIPILLILLGMAAMVFFPALRKSREPASSDPLPASLQPDRERSEKEKAGEAGDQDSVSVAKARGSASLRPRRPEDREKTVRPPSSKLRPTGRKPGGKKVKVKTAKMKPEEQLKNDFNAVLRLIRNQKLDQAYRKVKELLQNSEDPALLVIQADLIKRKNPTSPAVDKLLEQAMGRKSVLMDSEELERKIGNLWAQ